MKIGILYLLFFFISFGVYSQIDKNKSVEIKGFDFEYKADSISREEKDSAADLLKKSAPEPELNEMEKYRRDHPQNSLNSMTNMNHVDKDVLVKKYWNGKDVSQVKMTTNQELGTLNTTSEKLTIVCRDHSYVDGDRVRVYLNEKIYKNNVMLVGSYFSIDIELEDGFNRIDIEALNQGSSGPNTAEFKVIDQKGNLIADKEWNMRTGNIATLVVLKNQESTK
ncbi:MAG: hypothetical protein ABFR05_03940 [Bacteroidota bacterium]